MPVSEDARRIRARFEASGIGLSADQEAALVSYLGLLTKWNKTVNLTSLSLAPLTEDAIDRLLVEPFLAVAAMPQGAGLLIDVGSGSGSPAIPMKIARPEISLVMVESRTRKSAFLREAIRQLPLERAEVATGRLERETQNPKLREAANWISLRAVRADRPLWGALAALLKPDGLILWFRSREEAVAGRPAVPAYLPAFELEASRPLIPLRRSELAVLRRAAPRQMPEE